MTSEWMTPESIFNTLDLQKRYEQVDIAVFTPKCALVPASFHTPALSREMLNDVCDLEENDIVEYIPVPQFAAVLLYSMSVGATLPKVLADMVLKPDGTRACPLPEMFFMLRQLEEIGEYNKILASYMDGILYLVIAQGRTLLLCNTYKASDFTTAEYFLFLAMKRLQLNPEVSTIFFRTPLTEEQELSLYCYFRNIEKL